jgi:hypothetical protein
MPFGKGGKSKTKNNLAKKGEEIRSQKEMGDFT